MLELIAQTYAEAFRAGSASPTKDVFDALHLKSRDIAAKLVMECRKPDVGLLDPVQPRRAGGVRTPGVAESVPEADGAARPAST